MRAMHKKVVAIESMFEEPKTNEDDAAGNPILGPQPPKMPPPPGGPEAQTSDDVEGERNAKLLMTEFKMFQQMCKRLQNSAQALGEANDGEGGLNCFDDYREKTRLEDVEKALQNIEETAKPGGASFLNTLKMPPKLHGTRNLLVVMGLVRDLGP